MPEHPFRDRADDPPLEAVPAVGAHDHEIGAFRFDRTAHLRIDVSKFNFRRDWNLRRLALRLQFLKAEPGFLGKVGRDIGGADHGAVCGCDHRRDGVQHMNARVVLCSQTKSALKRAPGCREEIQGTQNPAKSQHQPPPSS